MYVLIEHEDEMHYKELDTLTREQLLVLAKQMLTTLRDENLTEWNRSVPGVVWRNRLNEQLAQCQILKGE